MQKLNSQFYIDKTIQIGSGRYSQVYKGFWVEQNKIIAVKYMSKNKFKNHTNYQRQIYVMEEFTHQNIMGYYGHEMLSDGLYCFTQFCSGRTLKELIKRQISQLKVLSLYKQLLEAMSYMNSKNKVHRDLKPDNIFLNQSQQLKIGDFGAARNIRMIMSRQVLCTPLYAAPEILNLEPYDQKCDVWSGGLILYEMLTGKQMFSHIQNKQQLNEEIQKFSRGQIPIIYPRQLDQQWTKLTEKMLTYDKKQRPSFSELLQYFLTICKKMEIDLNTKYGFDPQNSRDITQSRLHRQNCTPYASSINKNNTDRVDPNQKLREQASFKRFSNAQNYLIYLKIKTDFLHKIMKTFAKNQYRVLKNVYKHILIFLSVCCYISKCHENLAILKNNKITTPDKIIVNVDQLQPVHLKSWEQQIQKFQLRCTRKMDKYKIILDKHIVQKINGIHLQRQEQRKIIQSYQNLTAWIQESENGKFSEASEYLQLFSNIINGNNVYRNIQQLNEMSQIELKTYSYIRVVGHLDDFFSQKQYQHDDYFMMKIQQIENMSKEQSIQFIQKYNNKS